MTKPALSIENLRHAYQGGVRGGAIVLDGVTLAVQPGQIVSLLGESGSGKTTLLNLIAGALKLTNGKVETGGPLSYLQQDDLLLAFRTVLQNACLASELKGELSHGLIAEALSMLQSMRLEDIRGALPAELSGGMRRRVALARQLLARASIYLLDEPLGQQDRGMREVLEDMLYDRFHRSGSAALIVTHDLDSAVALSDRIAILGSARTIASDLACPPALSSLRPSARRQQPAFVDAVAGVWRAMWEATGHG